MERTALEVQLANSVPAAITIIGFPGEFFDWGVAAVETMLEATGCTSSRRWLTDESDVGEADAVQLVLSHGPYFSARPTPAPTLVFLDDPAAALRGLLGHNEDIVGMTRLLTQTIAPLGQVLRAPRTLLIRPAMLQQASVTMHDIATFLGVKLPLDASQMFAPPIQVTSPESLLGRIVDELLAPMIETVVTGVRQPYALPRECLLAIGPIPAPAVVDLVGPARLLYFGPYYHFLPGDWQVELDLFFSDDVHQTVFAAEVCTDAVLAKVQMRPGKGGLFRTSFPVRFSQPEARMELRVWVNRGAIEGRMGLQRVRFVP